PLEEPKEKECDQSNQGQRGITQERAIHPKELEARGACIIEAGIRQWKKIFATPHFRCPDRSQINGQETDEKVDFEQIFTNPKICKKSTFSSVSWPFIWLRSGQRKCGVAKIFFHCLMPASIMQAPRASSSFG